MVLVVPRVPNNSIALLLYIVRCNSVEIAVFIISDRLFNSKLARVYVVFARQWVVTRRRGRISVRNMQRDGSRFRNQRTAKEAVL